MKSTILDINFQNFSPKGGNAHLGHTSHGNGNTSHGNGNTSHRNGNTSHGNGNTSHGNGNTSHGNGNTSHGNGNTSHGNGNTSHGNGNTSHGTSNTSRGSRSIAKRLGNTLNVSKHPYRSAIFSPSYKVVISLTCQEKTRQKICTYYDLTLITVYLSAC